MRPIGIKRNLDEFKGFSPSIKNYMFMHWVGGFLLIYSNILPIFMYDLGIKISEASVIISVAALADVLLTGFASRHFKGISPNKAMFFDWITESIPPLIYAFSSSAFMIGIGSAATKLTSVLNYNYQVYEAEIYPEEKRSRIYNYHLITPEIFSMLLYPLVGWLLYSAGSVFSYRVIFMLCAIGYLFVSVIPLRFLEQVPAVAVEKTDYKFKFPREALPIASIQILLSISFCFVSPLITSYYILEAFNGNIFVLLSLEALNSLVIFITGLAMTNYFDEVPAPLKIGLSILGMVLSMGMLLVGQSLLVVIGALCIKSVSSTVWFPAYNSILMKHISKENRTQTFGAIQTWGKIVGIAAPVCSAVLISKIGFQAPFAVSMGIYVGIILIFFKYKSLLTE